MFSSNKAARPRQSPWVKVVESLVPSNSQALPQAGNSGDLQLEDSRSGQRLHLNESAAAIWSLCDGSRSVEDLLNVFAEHYPNQPQVLTDVVSQLTELVDSKALVLDGGEEALEYTGDVVRHIRPTAELLWHLELIRQFVFGCTRIEEASPIDNDLETLLNAEHLDIAKQRDVDAAQHNQDSTVLPYRSAMTSKSFQKSLKKITRELRLSLPEVESKIEVSGHSIYRSGSHMGWHSNHSRSDGRIYCSWAQKSESNFFRYVDPISGEIKTEWEQPGWNIKSFTIPPKTSRFWHCIGANSLRFSLGFRYEIPDV